MRLTALTSSLVVSILLAMVPTAAGATRTVKAHRPWVALHLLNYSSDADLEALAQQLPALAARGVNVLVLEVDYAFDFRSHPELRLSDKPITRAGASRG